MAFKLGKAEIERRAEIVEAINEAWGKLDDAINVYNDAVAALREPLADALAAYNESVSEARGFAEDVVSQADEDLGDKSEKWQEGERGRAAVEFKDAWEYLSFDEIEIEYPDDVAIDDPGYGSALDEAPMDAAEL